MSPPIFSLFSGSGSGSGSTASSVASKYDQAFSTGGDFSVVGLLAAGDYRLAIGAFANMSFAENLGSGTLCDGFIALGSPASLGDTSYRVAVTKAVPEVSPWALLLGLMVFALGARFGRSETGARRARAPGGLTPIRLDHSIRRCAMSRNWVHWRLPLNRNSSQ